MADNKSDKNKDVARPINIGQIIEVPIAQEMKQSYLDYAMSVIVSRALPDVRDGLKPVQRRIVYAAEELNLRFDARYSKCAKLVGDVMGKYHPHGNEAIYMSLVRMGQDFSLRYPLIDPQGNFGNIDGDPPAAMRYTECRLTKISSYLLKDIDKETVAFSDNYSATETEPDVLPSVIPNLLMNGAIGIAVGMATNIPPHNLSELIDGVFMIIDNATVTDKDLNTRTLKIYDILDIPIEIQDFEVVNNTPIEALVKVIKGPDFPTGCTIYDQSETLRYFATGRGKIVVRADVKIEEQKNGKYAIVITQIPYQVNRTTLIEKIADLAKNKKVEGITEIRNESSRGKTRIVVDLRRDVNPQKVLNYLYKHTQLQDAFNVNMLALVNGEPQLMGIKQVLDEFIKHRKIVIVNRTLFDLRKAKEREHILEGLKNALDFIDEVIAIIRKSADTDTARVKLIDRFDLTHIQATAILDMQLKRLAALEREKIENELKEIQGTINILLVILKNPNKLLEVLKAELLEVKEIFGDDRLTKVIKGKIGELLEEDIIENQEALVLITRSGYIKRTNPTAYKSQSRGGKGVIGTKTKDEDEVSLMKLTDTHSRILFFTNLGKVYEKIVWDIPDSNKNSKGTAIVNLIDITGNEKIEEFITIDKEANTKGKYIVMVTSKGMIKKTPLDEYENIRRNGITAMGLKNGDRVVRAELTDGNNDIILVTSEGKAIRFNEEDARPMGRTAGGVISMKLRGSDEIVSMEIVKKADEKKLRLMAIMAKGFGKATEVSEYPFQNRGGSGVIAAKVTDKTGKISTCRLLDDQSKDVILTSDAGQMIRIPAKSIPTLNRATQGVILMRLGGGDKIARATVIRDGEDQIIKL